MRYAEQGGSGRQVRRWRSVAEKRRIVQLTMEPEASVAEVARSHGLNANRVFKWRRAFEKGELVEPYAALLLRLTTARLRRGFQGLSAQVQTVLEQRPSSGRVFIFRGRRGDFVKCLWFDGDGLCLLAKRLDKGRFVRPKARSGTISLSRAQLSMLLEGIDWRRVATHAPRYEE